MTIAQKIVLLLGLLALIGLSLWPPITSFKLNGTPVIFRQFLYADGMTVRIDVYLVEVVVCLAVTGLIFSQASPNRR